MGERHPSLPASLPLLLLLLFSLLGLEEGGTKKKRNVEGSRVLSRDIGEWEEQGLALNQVRWAAFDMQPQASGRLGPALII